MSNIIKHINQEVNYASGHLDHITRPNCATIYSNTTFSMSINSKTCTFIQIQAILNVISFYAFFETSFIQHHQLQSYL